MVFGLWCLVISHILVRVHEDQRMVISHSLKQVSSSAIFGKVGRRQCQPVLRWQYHNASITMAGVVTKAQLQWDVHNAGLAIYTMMFLKPESHTGHDIIQMSIIPSPYQISQLQAKPVYSSVRGKIVWVRFVCATDVLEYVTHSHQGKVSKRRRKET